MDGANVPSVFQGALGQAISSPPLDPNLAALSRRIASSLGLPVEGGSTLALPVELCNPDILALAIDFKKKDEEDFLNAYYGRAESSLEKTMELMSRGPQLDLFVQGILRSVAGGGGVPPVVPPPHCGALGIEFVALLGLVRLLKGRRG